MGTLKGEQGLSAPVRYKLWKTFLILKSIRFLYFLFESNHRRQTIRRTYGKHVIYIIRCKRLKAGLTRCSVLWNKIILQISEHYKAENERKGSFPGFVTISKSMGYKQACKRASFALQKGMFYTSKGHLLQCKRASFTMQKSMY